MSIAENIRSLAERGDIAIVPFLVLGYPSISSSQEAVEFLSKLGVTIFETAMPVTHGWSNKASDIIKEAHLTACQNGVTAETVLDFFSDYRPNSYVLYEPSTRPSLDVAFKKMRSKVDMVILEKEPVNVLELHKAAERNGLRTVNAVSPTMDRAIVRSRTLGSDAFVYLTASSRTGGELYPLRMIQRSIAEVKAVKDIPVLCGFGIKTPEEVKAIGSLDGCDGMIVGTPLLKALKVGFKYFCDYFEMIVEATKDLKKRAIVPS